MENYGEIIDKIVEIIERAQVAKQKDSKSLESIRGYCVLKSDILEFKELLELESTFYKLSTTEEPTKKNDELLKLCQVRASVQNDQTDDYNKLAAILKSAYSKRASELSEHLGYYIPKDSTGLFHELCQKLNVGPSVMLRDIYNEEAKNAIKNYLNGNIFQFHRIQNHIINKGKPPIEKVSIVKEDLTIEELIVYLAERKDLDISSLDLFIPILGIHNYFELVKGLYSLGIIDKDSFVKINQKLLENDEIFVNAIDKYIDLTIGDSSNMMTR